MSRKKRGDRKRDHERKRQKKKLKRLLRKTRTEVSAFGGCEVRVGNTGLAKLSERLLKIAQPLLEQSRNETEGRAALELAAVGWNMALLPGEESRNELMEVAKEAVGPDRAAAAALCSIFTEVMERKRRLYPDDDRFILNYEMLRSGGSLRLVVASAVGERGAG